MKRENEIRRRLRSLAALQEAVGAMKSLSAHHVREARSAVEPARCYQEGVERILRWSGAGIAAGQGNRGLVVIGAELGLCGGYNAAVVADGRRAREQLGPGPTLCVGRRAAVMLARQGTTVDHVYQGPASTRGIARLLLALAEDVLSRFAKGDLSSFDIVSSPFEGVGKWQPSQFRLLPIASDASGSDRMSRYVSKDQLASAAVREFLYITLYQRILDASACEHGARLVATQAAERWLDDHTARVRRRLTAARREASTQEVIEIAAGARARSRL